MRLFLLCLLTLLAAVDLRTTEAAADATPLSPSIAAPLDGRWGEVLPRAAPPAFSVRPASATVTPPLLDTSSALSRPRSPKPPQAAVTGGMDAPGGSPLPFPIQPERTQRVLPPLKAPPAPATVSPPLLPPSSAQDRKPPVSTGGKKRSDGAENTARGQTTAKMVVEQPQDGEAEVKIQSVLTKRLAVEEAEPTASTIDMLGSLITLQSSIKQQIAATGKKLGASRSDAQKAELKEELARLDQQLAETGADFERIATGIEPAVLLEGKPGAFSWEKELSTLLEPTIKELKQLTARARLKTQLKDTIADYGEQATTATKAVQHLQGLIAEAKEQKVKAHLQELLPAWQNAENRITRKLDLARMELAKLEEKDVSLVESSSASMREFFRERGLFLLIAFVVFTGTLLLCRMLHRLLFRFLPGALADQRPFYIRIVDIAFKIFTGLAAVGGLVFVLYTAEDWFLLSLAIVFFLGLAWTVRQGIPRLWQQMRLVLNMGSLREGERIVYEGIPWRIESLNVFCKLANPALGARMRLPIESMIGKVSRPYSPEEPWFPCKKGDWLLVGDQLFAKVASLSPDFVELVEPGGRRTLFRTIDFLGKAPTNLSRNFSVKVPFALAAVFADTPPATAPARFKGFIERRLVAMGHGDDCLNLSVDFRLTAAAALDLVVIAHFKGEIAENFRRLERAIGAWCIECCLANGWLNASPPDLAESG